jgi:acetyltransferase-like isoleucine patch superfamily enzyme
MIIHWLLRRNIPPRVLAAGNPAEVIRPINRLVSGR